MTVCGYSFRNEALIREALTTPACRMTSPGIADNQRLEFLGDAVLGLLSAERLYAEFGSEPEGSLSMRRSHMVSATALCAAAGRLGLVQQLRLNRGGAPLSPKAKTVADAVEAVLGAAYLDGGLAAARLVFESLGLMAEGEEDAHGGNPKGALQEWSQSQIPPRRPTYELLEKSGTSHAPVFSVRVTIDGSRFAVASAGSHKEAEAKAAAALLVQMKASES